MDGGGDGTFDYDKAHYELALKCACRDCKAEVARYEADRKRAMEPCMGPPRPSVFTSAIAQAYKETLAKAAEGEDE